MIVLSRLPFLVTLLTEDFDFLQCVIDLNRNVLVIGTTGTETRFLPEAELPDYARSNAVDGKEDAVDEDVGLSKAIEESVRDQRKTKGGSTSPNYAGSSPKRQRRGNQGMHVVN